MRRRIIALVVMGLFLVGSMGVIGCSSSDDPAAEALLVTGTWNFSAIGFPTLRAVLTHRGTAITGTVSDAQNYSVAISGSTTAAAGLTEPRNIMIVVRFSDGQVLRMSGVVNDNNSSMSGNYTDTFGGADTWQAIRIQP